MNTYFKLYYIVFSIMFISCRHSIHDDYKIAKEKMEAKEWENAIALLTDIIQKDSSLPEAFQTRGMCYYSAEEYDLAYSDFLGAYELNKNPHLLFNLGIIHIKNEKYVDAINFLDKYEKFDNDNPNLWLQKALCYNAIEDFNKALAYYEKAHDYYEDSISLLKNMAICHFQLSNYSNAVQYLETLVDTLNDDISCFEMLTYSLHVTGRYKKANEYYNQMVALGFELDDKTQQIFKRNLSLLGIEQKNAQNFMAAIQTFSQVITLDPLNKDAFYHRGIVYLHFERRQEACEDFNNAFLNGSKEANSMMKLHCKEFFD